MCNKHIPVVVYDSGGKVTICGNCGKVLDKWKSNGNGKMHDKNKKKESAK